MIKNKFLIVLMIFCSCHSPDLNEESDDLLKVYEYEEDFNFYFKQNFDLELKDLNNDKLFIVPVSSCTPCVNEVLTNLQNNDCGNSAVLFVGRIEDDAQRNKEVEEITKKMLTYNDYESDLYNYQTDIGKPCVLFLDEDIVRKMPLDFSNNEETKAILNWK
jgi:hypothetical protein